MDELNLPYTICEVLVALGAVIGNSLVLVAFARERRLRRRTNYYIVSLAVADLLVGLVGIPCALLASVGLPRHLYACLLTISLLVVLCTISIFCLVAVSVDRYWAILFPMGYARNVTTKIAIWIILLCWVLGSVVGFLPLMGWHAPPTSPQLCLFTKVMDYNYLVFLYFATIVFPALLLAAFYAHIYSVVLNQFKQMLIINGTTENNSMLRVLGAARKREVKATQNLSIIVLFFIICWMPLYTINFIQAYCTECHVPSALLNSCIILSHLNSALNPLLYAYHLKDFRLALKYVVCGKKMNSLKRLDSNNTSNYDQHNKITNDKKYSTRSCHQNHKVQISHHGNRYNSCYYPATQKYSKMQIESINMQKFNENKSERKISKEDKERKLSSPGKLSPYRYQNWYHKFSEEAVRSSGSAGDELGSEQLSIDANNMIVIEGRKRSATFDKTKVNIEYIGRAAGSNAVSTEDMTDREESSENTRETNESPRATSVERIGEAGNTCERYSKATLLSERDNLERCQIEHIAQIGSKDAHIGSKDAHIGSKDAHIGSKELTILETINSSLENTSTCNHMTLRNVDDLQNQSDMKSELYAKEHVLETDTNATDKENVLNHGEVIVEENKTIKQPEENIQSKGLVNDIQSKGLVNDGFIENDTDVCKTSIAGLEMKPMEILQTGETQLKLTRKSSMNQETQHNACLEPDMNLIENVDNQFTDNTNKDFVNNTTAMGTCTNEQDIANNIRTPIHSIDRNFSNNTFDIDDTVKVNVNGLSPETTQKYQNEINDIHPNMTQESLIGRHASNTSISNELEYHEKEQAKENTNVHNEINTVMPSPEGHEFKDTNQSTNQHSIVSNDTLPRNSTRMFSSFKWRRRSREKIKPEEKMDGQEMKIEFKIFDINIVRHEEAPHSVDDTRKI